MTLNKIKKLPEDNVPGTRLTETAELFESRKQDHIRIALDPRTQAEGLSGLERVRLTHEALPDFDFSEISLTKNIFDLELKAPLFISSMTAGNEKSSLINSRLSEAAQSRGWAMGVGSQRKELSKDSANEWQEIRKRAPKAVLIGNLGIAQIISSTTDQVRRLVDNLEAKALFIHLNPLQEALQKEGTPNFKGGLKAIERVVRELNVPVIVKEVGCGLSQSTVERLNGVGVFAVDVSGLGGTHWGRIEGYRSEPGDLYYEASQTFKDWGLSTVESLLMAKEAPVKCQIWASGGVRSGLDAAKLFALNAEMVGVAKPMLEAALAGDKALAEAMEKFEFELKVAMFCTGVKNLSEFKQKRVWSWI